MCLIAFVSQVSSDKDCPFGAFLLVSNRDEVLDRPSQPLHHWGDGFGILAGKDMKFGGTWIGINRHGLLAALTNQIDVSTKSTVEHTISTDEVDVHSSFASRGQLVSHCLEKNRTDKHSSIQDVIDETIDQLSSSMAFQYYKGFALLFGHVIHNESVSPNLKLLYHPMEQSHLPLHQSCYQLEWKQPEHIYALSNGNPYESDWPKVQRIKHLLGSSLDRLLSSASKTKYQGHFWREYFTKRVLCDKEQIDISDYLSKHTLEKERIHHISSIFVPISPSSIHSGKDYGTKSSTIIMVGYTDGGMNVKCIEYDWVKYHSICIEQNKCPRTIHEDLFPLVEQVHTMFIPT